MKILWQHYGREEATWEPKATMKVQYPQLFNSGNNFEDEILLRGGRGGGGGGGGIVIPRNIPKSFYNKFRIC